MLNFSCQTLVVSIKNLPIAIVIKNQKSSISYPASSIPLTTPPLLPE